MTLQRRFVRTVAAFGAFTAATLILAPLVGATPISLRRAFDFSIPNIMRGPEVYGREPGRVQWSADSRWIYFQWNPAGTDWREPPDGG